MNRKVQQSQGSRYTTASQELLTSIQECLA